MPHCAEAVLFVKRRPEIPRLLFALRFKAASHLYLEQMRKLLQELLPEVRQLAEQLGNELDLVRVVQG